MQSFTPKIVFTFCLIISLSLALESPGVGTSNSLHTSSKANPNTDQPLLDPLTGSEVHPAISSPGTFISPFSLADVDLDDTTDFSANEALNHDYLLILDVDNLLFNFRVTASIDAPGQSYGGWEGSTVEVRGQFIGHYLSALSFAYKSTGNPEFQRRADAIITGLADCQAAHQDGYLSAFPKSHFDRLEALQPVWAPYYVIHKIMAGLLDQHQLNQQPDALPILLKMASYFCDRSTAVVQTQGLDHWHQILDNEFGGMNDVLYKLYIETGNAKWAHCAALFDKPVWLQPMANGTDVLNGLHGNTHLAQINGFVSRFEATGDEAAKSAVENFFGIITSAHSFSTGGSNWFERWFDPHSLGNAINNSDAAANTQESCTTYNILKIARALFRWSGNAYFADFYERAIMNGVLGVQRIGGAPSNTEAHSHHEGHSHSHSHFLPPQGPSPAELAAIDASNALHALQPRPEQYKIVSWPDDPVPTFLAQNTTLSTTIQAQYSAGGAVQSGQYIYYMPLGGYGAGKGNNPRAWTHGWGDRFNTFWCCYGTAVESFSKLADSIYFWFDPEESRNGNKSPPDLFVNQLISSTLRWKKVGVSIKQIADLYGTVSTKDVMTNDGAIINVATSKLEISLLPSPSSENKEKTAAEDKVEFNLHWRLPAWIDWKKESEFKLVINGEEVDVQSLPRSCGSPGGCTFDTSANGSGTGKVRQVHAQSFSPPKFGQGADYVILGPSWKDGDTVEVQMPMKVFTEDLNDSRPEAQSLKAVVMGPFLMAALTDGDREIDLDAKDVENALSLPSAASNYPKGARLLSGKRKSYLMVPLGHVIDEQFTAYLEFAAVAPSESQNEAGAVQK